MKSIVQRALRSTNNWLGQVVGSLRAKRVLPSPTTAMRIGPARVILRIVLGDHLSDQQVAVAGLTSRSLNFDPANTLAENVLVSMVPRRPSYAQTHSNDTLKYQVTLKVNPATTVLSVTYQDQHRQIRLTEKIAIY